MTQTNTEIAGSATIFQQPARSLDHLKAMDETLRSSQEMTGAMVSATRQQLKILAQEQANKLAQLAKKPKLVLHYGDNGPPLGVGAGGFNIKPRKEIDTSMTMDFSLVNEGDAIATSPTLRIVAPRGVTLVSAPFVMQGPIEGSPDSDYHAYLANLINLRPQARVPTAITFNYPAGTRSFHITFSADADEIGTGVLLGGFDFVPTPGVQPH